MSYEIRRDSKTAEVLTCEGCGCSVEINECNKCQFCCELWGLRHAHVTKDMFCQGLNTLFKKLKELKDSDG